jgi:hypothetical protein
MRFLLIAGLIVVLLWLVQVVVFLLGYRHSGRSSR